MILAARLTNTRGNAKVMADDTRLQVELTYKNKIVGTLSMYPIRNEHTEDLGYRVTWGNKVIEEEEKAHSKDTYCNE